MLLSEKIQALYASGLSVTEIAARLCMLSEDVSARLAEGPVRLFPALRASLQAALVGAPPEALQGLIQALVNVETAQLRAEIVSPAEEVPALVRHTCGPGYLFRDYTSPSTPDGFSWACVVPVCEELSKPFGSWEQAAVRAGCLVSELRLWVQVVPEFSECVERVGEIAKARRQEILTRLAMSPGLRVEFARLVENVSASASQEDRAEAETVESIEEQLKSAGIPVPF